MNNDHNKDNNTKDKQIYDPEKDNLQNKRNSSSKSQIEFCGWEVDDDIQHINLDFIKVLNSKLMNSDNIEELRYSNNKQIKIQERKTYIDNDMGYKQNNTEGNMHHSKTIRSHTQIHPYSHTLNYTQDLSSNETLYNNSQALESKTNNNYYTRKKIKENSSIEGQLPAYKASFYDFRIQQYNAKNHQNYVKLINEISIENENQTQNSEKNLHSLNKSSEKQSQSPTKVAKNFKSPEKDKKNNNTLSLAIENSQIIDPDQLKMNSFSAVVDQVKSSRMEEKLRELFKIKKSNNIKNIKDMKYIINNNNNNARIDHRFKNLLNSPKKAQNYNRDLIVTQIKSLANGNSSKKYPAEGNKSRRFESEEKNLISRINQIGIFNVETPKRFESHDPLAVEEKTKTNRTNNDELPIDIQADLHEMFKKSIVDVKKGANTSQLNPSFANLKKTIGISAQMPLLTNEKRIKLKSSHSQLGISNNNPRYNDDKGFREGIQNHNSSYGSSLAAKLVVEAFNKNKMNMKHYINKSRESTTSINLEKYNNSQKKAEIEPHYSKKYEDTIKKLKNKQNPKFFTRSHTDYSHNLSSILNMKLINEGEKTKGYQDHEPNTGIQNIHSSNKVLNLNPPRKIESSEVKNIVKVKNQIRKKQQMKVQNTQAL